MNKKNYIIIFSVSLFILICVGLFFWFIKGNETEEDNSLTEFRVYDREKEEIYHANDEKLLTKIIEKNDLDEYSGFNFTNEEPYIDVFEASNDTFFVKRYIPNKDIEYYYNQYKASEQADQIRFTDSCSYKTTELYSFDKNGDDKMKYDLVYNLDPFSLVILESKNNPAEILVIGKSCVAVEKDLNDDQALVVLWFNRRQTDPIKSNIVAKDALGFSYEKLNDEIVVKGSSFVAEGESEEKYTEVKINLGDKVYSVSEIKGSNYPEFDKNSGELVKYNGIEHYKTIKVPLY